MNPDPSEDVLLERRELDARGRLAAKLVFAGVLTDEDDASLEDEDLDLCEFTFASVDGITAVSCENAVPASKDPLEL